MKPTMDEYASLVSQIESLDLKYLEKFVKRITETYVKRCHAAQERANLKEKAKQVVG